MFDLNLEDIFTKDTFDHALKRLKHTALGLDGLSIDDLCTEAFFAELKDEILNLSYSPQPLKRAFIPKENKDELRKLAISKTAASQITLLKTKKSLRIAQQFIIGKLKNQINYLKYLDKYHKSLSSHISSMQEILTSHVPNAQSVSELLGFEGSSANAYWQAIAKAIDYKFSFTARITQGATDIVNSALNYGYAILYSKILKSIAAVGLSPHVSYLHALDEQKPTLAFDLIEEFRAFIVDRAIISMVNKNEPFEIKDGLLSAKTRQNIAKNVNEKLFAYTQYRGEQLKAQDIIDKQAYALKRAVTQNEKYKPFIGRFQ